MSGRVQSRGVGGRQDCWVRLRRSGFTGFNVLCMANRAITKEARRAAREAAAASQEELLRRTRANVEDLAAFFSARGREDAIEAWLSERVNGVLAQAAQRRSKARVSAGGALRAMRDRGENLREIARMAGVPDKAVRELIREAEAAAPPGAQLQTGVEDSEPSDEASSGADARLADFGARTSEVDRSEAEQRPARANA